MAISTMTAVIKRARTVLAVVLGAAIVAVSMPAMAQEVPPEQLALARKYVDLTDTAGIYEITLVEISMGTMRELTLQSPQLAEEIDQTIGDVLATYRERRGELYDQFARIYATSFTFEELQQIVAFYESPTGKKLSQTNTVIASDLQTVLQVFTNNIRPEFFAKVRAELRAKGHEV